MTTTMERTTEQPKPADSAKRSRTVIVAVALAVALVVAVGLTGRFVADRTDSEARVQHHRGLVLAAIPQLDAAMQRALRQPVSQRPALAIPWRDGPQLGPGQPDIAAQGSPVIKTSLLRSAPDAVVAEMVVTSDGYTSTVVQKWSDGGASSDSCSFSNLPGQQSEQSVDSCRELIGSVPDVDG